MLNEPRKTLIKGAIFSERFNIKSKVSLKGNKIFRKA